MIRDRLCEQLRRDIREGRWTGGARLPSTRVLARQMGIGRNTAIEVYETLCAEGWLEARTGQGTFVSVKQSRHPADLFAEAHYPARIARLRDPDGHSLYIRY